jgi:hypothetical protein
VQPVHPGHALSRADTKRLTRSLLTFAGTCPPALSRHRNSQLCGRDETVKQPASCCGKPAGSVGSSILVSACAVLGLESQVSVVSLACRVRWQSRYKRRHAQHQTGACHLFLPAPRPLRVLGAERLRACELGQLHSDVPRSDRELTHKTPPACSTCSSPPACSRCSRRRPAHRSMDARSPAATKPGIQSPGQSVDGADADSDLSDMQMLTCPVLGLSSVLELWPSAHQPCRQ